MMSREWRFSDEHSYKYVIPIVERSQTHLFVHGFRIVNLGLPRNGIYGGVNESFGRVICSTQDQNSSKNDVSA